MPNLMPLFDGLARIYEAEGRPGGDEAAAALRYHRHDRPITAATRTHLTPFIASLLHRPDALPVAARILPLLALMPWHYSGLSDGRIRPEIAQNMATCELIGPNGLIRHNRCKVGLFVQSAEIDYPARHHAAEETFVMLAGEGNWQSGDGPWQTQLPGSYIHHPSMTLHQSRSGPAGFIAAWRWTGEIGLDSYKLVG